VTARVFDLVEQAIGERPVSSAALSGGCVAQVARLEMRDGSRLVAKIGEAGVEHGTLDLEAYMLRELRAKSDLRVPGVVYGSPGLLVMEHINNDGRRTVDGEREAGWVAPDRLVPIVAPSRFAPSKSARGARADTS